MRTRTWIALLVVTALSAAPVETDPPPESASSPTGAVEESPAASDTEILEEFIPSEEVPADSAIAFPVDI